MIAWLNPGALFLLAAVAAPVLIHWLLRRRAVRRAFPTIRFLTVSERSAVRLYRPSDVVLLILRAAIVACAGLAIAQPLLITNSRRESWGGRVTRAIVVDTSGSVNAALAAEAAEASTAGANAWRRFDAVAVETAVERAAAWLQGAEPGRREITIVSDFQRGAITDADVMRLPGAIGLRLLRVESVVTEPVAFEAGAVLGGGKTYTRSVVANADSTAVSLRPSTDETVGLEIGGASAERLRRIVSVAGAVAPSSEQPILIRFGAPSGTTGRSLGGWTRDAALRLFASREAAGVRVHSASQDRNLVLHVDVPSDSLAAARITQATLNARQDPGAWADREPGTIPESILARWTRAPAAPDADAWQRTTESDGRWLWVAAVLLMGVESVVRRERRQPVAQTEAHAA